VATGKGSSDRATHQFKSTRYMHDTAACGNASELINNSQLYDCSFDKFKHLDVTHGMHSQAIQSNPR